MPNQSSGPVEVTAVHSDGTIGTAVSADGLIVLFDGQGEIVVTVTPDGASSDALVRSMPLRGGPDRFARLVLHPVGGDTFGASLYPGRLGPAGVSFQTLHGEGRSDLPPSRAVTLRWERRFLSVCAEQNVLHEKMVLIQGRPLPTQKEMEAYRRGDAMTVGMLTLWFHGSNLVRLQVDEPRTIKPFGPRYPGDAPAPSPPL